MAYITKEKVAEMRKAIKKAYPAKEGWKFSVRKDGYTAVNIRLMQFPAEYKFKEGHSTINPRWLERNAESIGWGEKELDVVRTMDAVAHEGHWDESDIMTDYFNCAWYVSLSFGMWDNPAVAVNK